MALYSYHYKNKKMKKIVYAFFAFFLLTIIRAQENPQPDFKKMTPEQRREYIKKLSPEQRRKLIDEAATVMAIRKLQIPVEKQAEFKVLFNEYSQSQKAIKDKFKSKASTENLSDEEARKMLDQSFELGQQLLNNRKVYTEKFLKILTPQQVLKLFTHEGRMRDKILEHRQNGASSNENALRKREGQKQ